MSLGFSLMLGRQGERERGGGQGQARVVVHAVYGSRPAAPPWRARWVSVQCGAGLSVGRLPAACAVAPPAGCGDPGMRLTALLRRSSGFAFLETSRAGPSGPGCCCYPPEGGACTSLPALFRPHASWFAGDCVDVSTKCRYESRSSCAETEPERSASRNENA